jgi:non-heme chloroperoxidase
MATITTADGTDIYYKDWGSGQPMLFFLQHGYRVVASDRRGHGRSSQVSDGHDMDHYADDLAAVVRHGTLKTYKGFPHGMITTQAETINADLLAWLKS